MAPSSAGTRQTNTASQAPRTPKTPGKGHNFHSFRSPRRGQQSGEDADDITPEAARLLTEKDAEIAELQQLLENETRRAAMADSELRLALAAAQKAEEAHATELAKVEGDVKHVLAERRVLIQKLQTIEVVEDAIKELYIQMKDRIAHDGTPTPAQLQQEKEQLKDANILVVLGSLHALLKNLWAFKVDSEEQLRGSQLLRQQQQEGTVLSLKAQVRDLEGQLRRAQQDIAAARLQADVEAEARDNLLQESQAVAAAMAAQHSELLAALRAAVAESEGLKHALGRAQEEGKRRDGLVLLNRQLESAKHFDRVSQDRQLRRLQADHTRQLQAMQRELSHINDLLARNDLLKQQLERATSTASSYKKQAQASSTYEQRIAHLEAALAAAQKAKEVSNAHSNASTTTAHVNSQSMVTKAERVMEALREKARISARLKAAEEEQRNRVTSIADVHLMHKQAKEVLKEVRQELAEGPAAARLRDQGNSPLASAELSQLTPRPHTAPGTGWKSATAAAAQGSRRGPLLVQRLNC